MCLVLIFTCWTIKEHCQICLKSTIFGLLLGYKHTDLFPKCCVIQEKCWIVLNFNTCCIIKENCWILLKKYIFGLLPGYKNTDLFPKCCVIKEKCQIYFLAGKLKKTVRFCLKAQFLDFYLDINTDITIKQVVLANYVFLLIYFVLKFHYKYIKWSGFIIK